MLQLLLRIALGGALAGAALAKLAAPGHSRDALATFGLSRPSTRVVALAAIVCLELGLAAGVIAGLSLATMPPRSSSSASPRRSRGRSSAVVSAPRAGASARARASGRRR